jgi:hypothetical protein
VFYVVVSVQTAINAGVTTGSILLAADCLKVGLFFFISSSMFSSSFEFAPRF